MRGRGAAAIAAGALTLVVLAVFAFHAQQQANRAVLSRLDEVRSTLRDEAARSGER